MNYTFKKEITEKYLYKKFKVFEKKIVKAFNKQNIQQVNI